MRTLMCTVLALVVSVPAAAQNYVAPQQLTVSTSSVGFTAATINQGSGHPQANQASCRVETARIRFQADGSAPTSSVGTPLEISDVIQITGNDLINRFRAIRTGGTDGLLNCTFVNVGSVGVSEIAINPGSASAAGGGLTDTELRATAVPVSGTVTANLSATDNTVLDDILTGVTATLTEAASSATSLDNIETGLNPDAVTGNTALSTGPQVHLNARKTLPTPVTNGQSIRAAGDAYGRAYVVGPLLTHTGSNGTGVTATTTSVIAAPSAGTHLRLYRVHIVNTSATACVVRWRDGAAGAQHWPAYLVQGGVHSLYFDGGWDLTSATRLDLVLSTTCTIEYSIAHETVID